MKGIGIRAYSIEEKKPDPFVSVLAFSPSLKPLPQVHECYIDNDGCWHSANIYGMEDCVITHWAEMPERLDG